MKNLYVSKTGYENKDKSNLTTRIVEIADAIWSPCTPELASKLAREFLANRKSETGWMEVNFHLHKRLRDDYELRKGK